MHYDNDFNKNWDNDNNYGNVEKYNQRMRTPTPYPRWVTTQLEFVAKISNLKYIDMLQCIGDTIHWSTSIYWSTQYIETLNILKCFNVLCPQYIEACQYIANYLFLQRTLTANAFAQEIDWGMKIEQIRRLFIIELGPTYWASVTVLLKKQLHSEAP